MTSNLKEKIIEKCGLDKGIPLDLIDKIGMIGIYNKIIEQALSTQREEFEKMIDESLEFVKWVKLTANEDRIRINAEKEYKRLKELKQKLGDK